MCLHVCVFILYIYTNSIQKPVLCALISVVAWTLVEEAPHDIVFFLRIQAWNELCLMAVIFLATMFYSLTLGMAIGVGLSLLRVVHHATRPRIQILGRIPGTNRFENAESETQRPAELWGDDTDNDNDVDNINNVDINRVDINNVDDELDRRRRQPLEFVKGCMIVKIPEPLTFANTGELKSRLGRLERYGTSAAHPALPRLRREDSHRNVIFDIHGVTSLDGAGVQVLEEIVRSYRVRGVRVFFTRGPWPKAAVSLGLEGRDRADRHAHPVWILMERAGIVDLVGGEAHFLDDVEDALRMTEALDGQAA